MLSKDGKLKQSVVIVGAGIIGSSLARELVRGGSNVTLVDAGEAGTGTTAASFAWVNSYLKEPHSYAQLNALGLAAHERWAAEHRGRRWFHQTGNLKLAFG